MSTSGYKETHLHHLSRVRFNSESGHPYRFHFILENAVYWHEMVGCGGTQPALLALGFFLLINIKYVGCGGIAISVLMFVPININQIEIQIVFKPTKPS